jgi:hypothetical protein
MEILKMKPQNLSSGHPAPPPSPRDLTNVFHSVEFALDQPNMLYQFKLWNSENDPIFLVVREDSAVIGSLRTGHECDMKFYSHDKARPTACYRARIDRITKDREGRFRDHWRVALEIVDDGHCAQLN